LKEVQERRRWNK